METFLFETQWINNDASLNSDEVCIFVQASKQKIRWDNYSAQSDCMELHWRNLKVKNQTTIILLLFNLSVLCCYLVIISHMAHT